MTQSTLILSALALTMFTGCTLSRSQEVPPSELVGGWRAEPPETSSLLFNKDGGTIASPVRRDSGYTEPDLPEWEITKSFNAGRTRISAARHRGDATDYYTSSSGPNGSTARRRVVSQSSNLHAGHRH